jgi:hypothetical protein
VCFQFSVSLYKNRLVLPLIFRTHPVLHCLQWLVAIVVASVLRERVPTMMSAHRPLNERGWTSPPAGHHRCLVKFPSNAVVLQGLLLCCDADFPIVWFRAPSNVVSEPTVVMKLWEQLLVRERGLNEREDALLDREHGMVEAKCALGGGRGARGVRCHS